MYILQVTSLIHKITQKTPAGQTLYRTLSLHLSLFPFVPSLFCPFVPLSLCPLVPLSLCPFVPLSLFSFVPLSLNKCVGTQFWSKETNERTSEQTNKRMKIKKPGVGWPLLSQAKIILWCRVSFKPKGSSLKDLFFVFLVSTIGFRVINFSSFLCLFNTLGCSRAVL